MDSTILAYFDPGSGSMLVQVLIGGVAGLMVFARYLWDNRPGWWPARKLTESTSVERA